ncbi:MAG: hypothetical protein IJQ43_02665 [Oscillospiraceae bacterium]|nr:hypothetical protein [Oscillospiraceae bacterium]
MKKTSIAIVLLLAAALIVVCALRRDEKTAPPAAESVAALSPQTGSQAALPNPVRESSMEELSALFGVELRAPEDASDVVYSLIETEPQVAQMNFTRGGISCSCRISSGDALRDISGLYYDWETSVLDSGRGLSMKLVPGGPGVASCFCEPKGLVLSLALSSGADKELLRSLFDEIFGAPIDAADGLAAQLCEQFDALRAACFPGTAGSSLSSAACAAEMADFFSASGIGPDSVERILRSYCAALSQEDAQLFETQLELVAGAFGRLTEEGGEGLLSDCGYESSTWPWDGEDVRDCFAALLGTD